ncbi:hypothetical protein PAAG_12614 [Paracoccidioides lutzii Pb01]|uniref:Uncharacterized protein n=1 Tax=Paracoccidioides lutzii (strain ATCC MYA-826 / Pb01) TaxID=502779 RepID=A0A0A2V2Z2_PARBA|nr:hypothetical protein PAAG_12614 [Paracoccidioides lutzii Pb01]KGQ00722.1 hypothetical protein PAAG_12614 [Paracoccidioides lutzii Pb01]
MAPSKKFSLLPIRLGAEQLILDVAQEKPIQLPRDDNVYELGEIGSHNVVIACMPLNADGKASTAVAVVVVKVQLTFASVTFVLEIGVEREVPSQFVDIRLGDILVS